MQEMSVFDKKAIFGHFGPFLLFEQTWNFYICILIFDKETFKPMDDLLQPIYKNLDFKFHSFLILGLIGGKKPWGT